jgi:hypothetical protein
MWRPICLWYRARKYTGKLQVKYTTCKIDGNGKQTHVMQTDRQPENKYERYRTVLSYIIMAAKDSYQEIATFT